MKHVFGVLIAAAMMIAAAAPVQAADTDVQAKVKNSMSLLKEKLSKQGAPKLGGPVEQSLSGEGTSEAASKTVPEIWFGSVKINGTYDVVDEVKKEMGGTATVFVKAGDEYVRVSTNVLKDDGARAIGTQLAHNPAYKAINEGQAFYGQVEILGNLYDTGYEPIEDVSGKTIGIYYVGYKKP